MKNALLVTGFIALTGFGMAASAQERAPKVPARTAAPTTARTARPAQTAPAAPSRAPNKANPRDLPTVAGAFDHIKAIIAYQQKKRAALKTFGCPASVRAAAGTGIGPATLAFSNATVSQNVCSASSDLAPLAERGERCLRCNYQSGVTLQRSGPKSHTCWVKPDANNSFACEYVPPLPASQTCSFQIDPASMDLYPFGEHTRGDSDMHTGGSLFDPGSLVTLELVVTLARSGNKLVWKLSGEAKETSPDYTTFSEQKSVDLKSSDVKNGSVADIETCLAAYGAQRPFAAPSTTYRTAFVGEGWESVSTGPLGGFLQFSLRCRVDTAGSENGQLGCQNIDIEPSRST